MKEQPFIFISGLRREFEKIRSDLKSFCKESMGLEVLVFEKEDVPGSQTTVEECERWSRECDLFILLAGKDYGYECPKGMSFTELEYDAAMKNNPKKIRAFVKKTQPARECRQEEFINRVSSGVTGRRYKQFESDKELMKLVPKTIVRFLINPVESGELPTLRMIISRGTSGFKITIYNKNSEKIQIIDPTVFNGVEFNDLWIGKSIIEPDNHAISEPIPVKLNALKKHEDGRDKHKSYKTGLNLILTIESRKYLLKFQVDVNGDHISHKLLEYELI
jgi:hypothetical protein